ncbi:MAG TPA: molybdopterin-dependent oxidoreductase, partial [Acetobacteraceae bacterium]|nr:molybdopterin-dependent oxidoreductase [Acetobacteraceae bacterium]
MPKDTIEYSQPIGDRVAYTTCYMCACRCGIKVHVKDGTLRYIEGNRDHPVNRGVLCGKGSAGIMNVLSPARLRKPLKRVGPRGAGEFKEIEWGEALTIATDRLARIRATDPNNLAFFTGRDQSQSLTGYFAQMFGTMNFAAHGGFCTVNMAAAGLYTVGGAFWEFGEPDWEFSKLFLMIGIAEDHDSNPIKLGLSRLKERGAKIIAVNPVRTGYAAIADEFVAITPGTDGLFIFALIHCLLESGNVDPAFLVRYTNAHYLVIDSPGAPDHGLFARDAQGKPLAWDRTTNSVADAESSGLDPALLGTYLLPDNRSARPAFALVADRYLA